MKAFISLAVILAVFGCEKKKPPIVPVSQDWQDQSVPPHQSPQTYYNPAPAPVYIQQKDSSASDYLMPWMMMNSINNGGSSHRRTVEHHYHGTSYNEAPRIIYPSYPSTTKHETIQTSPIKPSGRYSSGGSYSSKPSFSPAARSHSYSHSKSSGSRYSTPFRSSSGSRYSKGK